MHPMGGDFHFSIASNNFLNMDKILEYITNNEDLYDM